jgi:hypothetical protein
VNVANRLAAENLAVLGMTHLPGNLDAAALGHLVAGYHADYNSLRHKLVLANFGGE